MRDQRNSYYGIACEDLLFLNYAVDSSMYNNIAVLCQQVAEKMLKSVGEIVCTNIEGLLGGHNLRALYDAIHATESSFSLDRHRLSTLKDYYYDAKYPGENFVVVTCEECEECLDIAYDVVDAVNSFRSSHELEVMSYDRRELP